MRLASIQKKLGSRIHAGDAGLETECGCTLQMFWRKASLARTAGLNLSAAKSFSSSPYRPVVPACARPCPLLPFWVLGSKFLSATRVCPREAHTGCSVSRTCMARLTITRLPATVHWPSIRRTATATKRGHQTSPD